MFRTAIIPRKNEDKINLSDHILCVGSCFANMVGRKLKEHKFNVNINPYGTIFNPASICKLLSYTIENRFPSPNTYLKNQDVFYNYDLHSDFSSLSEEQLKGRIEQVFRKTASGLSKVNWLVLTFGTAIIYERKETSAMVTNCHKMPSDLFNKRFLTVEEIKSDFDLLLNKIISLNKNIKIVLTVSPIRHLKDSMELNTVSKSILRITCHHLAESFPQVVYFPGYEIMMDDLRDYRFYKRDMIHPSEEAEDYIWDIFVRNHFADKAKVFIDEWQKVQRSLSHKPFHPQSEDHQNFLKKLLVQLHNINHTVDVSAEIRKVEEGLKN